MTFRGFTLFRFELSTWASHAGAYHSKSQCVFWGVSFHCRITFRSHWCALVYIGIDRLIAFVKIIFAFELHSITETLAQRCCFYACKDLYESVTFFFRRNPHFILQENEIVHSVNVLTHTFMSWGVPVCRTCAHSAWEQRLGNIEQLCVAQAPSFKESSSGPNNVWNWAVQLKQIEAVVGAVDFWGSCLISRPVRPSEASTSLKQPSACLGALCRVCTSSQDLLCAGSRLQKIRLTLETSRRLYSILLYSIDVLKLLDHCVCDFCRKNFNCSASSRSTMRESPFHPSLRVVVRKCRAVVRRGGASGAAARRFLTGIPQTGVSMGQLEFADNYVLLKRLWFCMCELFSSSHSLTEMFYVSYTHIHTLYVFLHSYNIYIYISI